MNSRIICIAALAAAVAACSSAPARNSLLDQARINFDVAGNDPRVISLAADELKVAGESLGRAELAWKDGEKLATVDHLAYMATQRVAIAQETAASRAAQATVAGAGAERDRARLALRTSEVASARQQLAAAQQTNAIRSSELASSKQQLAQARESNLEQSSELALADAENQREQELRAASDARADELELQLQELNAKKTERGMVVTFGDVMFNSGRSQILPGASANMEKLAGFFRSNPQRMAVIEGHTDSVGAASANYTLSSSRADAVKDALVKLGVSGSQLSTRGYGADKPLANNGTEAGRQMNRRVEIVFAAPVEPVTAK